MLALCAMLLVVAERLVVAAVRGLRSMHVAVVVVGAVGILVVVYCRVARLSCVCLRAPDYWRRSWAGRELSLPLALCGYTPAPDKLALAGI